MGKNKKTSSECGSIFGRRSRKFQRARLPGFVCQLADDRALFKGAVDELSVQGFRMSNVHQAFCDESKIFRAIISDGENYYRISVTARWSELSDHGKGSQVGFKILDNDWKWVHFSMNILPSLTEEKSTVCHQDVL